MALQAGERHNLVRQSEIRRMSAECTRAGGINLAQGLCDLEVPAAVIDGAARAMRDGANIYTPAAGLPELRRAIASHLERHHGLRFDPGGEIIVSAGATGAMYATCLALLSAGDEVVLFEPYYGYHHSTLAAVGARPAYLRTRPPDWSFDESTLEAAVTSRTRAIILNTPANPSGKVFSATELATVARVAEQHDLFVFTDEIYAHFVYDDHRHIAPASLPGMKERTVTISGFSKTFSITGWRIGYAACDARWAPAIGHFNDLVYVCAPAPLQLGVARGIETLSAGAYADIAAAHRRKRERICTALDAAGLYPHPPTGAYYVLADISRIPGADSTERALCFLDRTGVAAVPGSAFYHDDGGDRLARFCFSKNDSVLDEACRRIERYSG